MAYEPGRATARPDLAVTAPAVSEDGRTVTVKLRPGVRFSPPVEREVTAADVKYAIERGFFKTVNNPYAPAYFGDLVGAKPAAEPGTQIAGIVARDEQTLVFKLTRSTGGTLAAALVLPLAAPVPREYALPLDREKVSGYGVKQVATGPYMVGEYEPGTKIELVRNPSWDAATDFRPAYLDRISMPQGNDDATVASRRVLQGKSMVTGDYLLPPAVLKEAVTRRSDQLELVDSGGGRWAALNTQAEPFDDINVRKAVLAGFDRRATLLALGGEQVGTVATHFLPPGMPGFEQAGGADGTGADFLGAPEGDPEVASAYLKKAGFADGRYKGEPILMVGPQDGNGRRIAELAKGSFEKLGFDVRLQLLSQQIVQTKYCGFPASAVAVCPNVGWARDFADGQTFLDPTFNGASIQPVGNANVSQLDVPAVNEAIDRASLLIDPAERADAWAEADRAIVAEAPAIPLVWDKVSMAHSNNVDAVPNENLGVWDFAFTSLR
jgi:peptide/nickel transport system substrate-binding protein